MKAALVIFESGPIMSGPSDGRGPMYHVCTSKVQGGVRTESYICRLSYMPRMLSAFDKEIAKD